MMKNTLKRGFTLIELLVVIAIIGILASVVLASLNTARDKGEDAAAKQALNNARAQAELFYDDYSRSYDDGTDNVCDSAGSDNGISDLIASAEGSVGGTALCAHDDDEWAAEILLNSDQYYCVDSTGYGGDVGLTATIVEDTDIACN